MSGSALWMLSCSLTFMQLLILMSLLLPEGSTSMDIDSPDDDGAAAAQAPAGGKPKRKPKAKSLLAAALEQPLEGPAAWDNLPPANYVQQGEVLQPQTKVFLACSTPAEGKQLTPAVVCWAEVHGDAEVGRRACGCDCLLQPVCGGGY